MIIKCYADIPLLEIEKKLLAFTNPFKICSKIYSKKNVAIVIVS